MGASLWRAFLWSDCGRQNRPLFCVGGAEWEGTMLWANRVARSRVGELRRQVASSWRLLCKLCIVRMSCDCTTDAVVVHQANACQAPSSVHPRRVVLRAATRHGRVLRACCEPHKFILCIGSLIFALRATVYTTVSVCIRAWYETKKARTNRHGVRLLLLQLCPKASTQHIPEYVALRKCLRRGAQLGWPRAVHADMDCPPLHSRG